MMNKRKVRLIGGFLAISLMAAMILPTIPTYAGISTTTVDISAYTEEISNTDWYNNDNDITMEDGAIVFPDDSSDTTKLISNAIVRHSNQLEKMLEVKFSIDFTSLPEGQQFAFVAGMQSLTAELSNRGNLELQFSQKNGEYQAGIKAYAEDGIPTNIMQEVSCGNTRIDVQLEIYTTQDMKLVINGKTVYDGHISVSAAGSYGFLQTGDCGAKVRDLVIKSYRYDAVEAPSFTEDFESGYFNANTLYSKSIQGSGYSPRIMSVQDLEGNKVFFIQNMGMSYIGTTYAYSNFEFTFDVVYSQGSPKLDEEGKVVSPANDPFGLAFGSDGISHASHEGYTSAANTFVINSSGGVYTVKKASNQVTPKFRAEDGTFSVKLSVLDGVVILSMKQLTDTTYQEVYKYSMDETPTGNVAIWIPSGCTGGWGFDNIKMTNMDEGQEELTVDFRSSKIEPPKDFPYEPLGYEYNPNREIEDVANDTSFMWQPVIITTTVCVVVLACVIVCVVLRNRKRGIVNEK